MDEAQAGMTEVLLTIPNIPSEEVPEGRDASDNVVVKRSADRSRRLAEKRSAIGTCARNTTLWISTSV